MDPERPFRLLEYGPTCAMFELDAQVHVEDLSAHLRTAIDAGTLTDVEDMVPAARTLMVLTRTPATRTAVVGVAETWSPSDEVAATGAEHRIEVVYDGPDIDEVRRLTGMDRDEIISIHSDAEYRVAFMGFAPGFGYLTGLPEVLHLPRRKDPRTRVPPRSVAIAGEYSAVYPRVSPGGWNLIGRSLQPMWRDDSEQPNVLAPGDLVRFLPVESSDRRDAQ